MEIFNFFYFCNILHMRSSTRNKSEDPLQRIQWPWAELIEGQVV